MQLFLTILQYLGLAIFILSLGGFIYALINLIARPWKYKSKKLKKGNTK
jgi:hypothetical protein